MSRRRKAQHREIQPDNVYDSIRVSKFINGLMRNGAKSLAEGIFYGALQILEEKTGKPGLETFEKAINEVKPVLEIKSRRVGGATYQVPVEVREGRRVVSGSTSDSTRPASSGRNVPPEMVWRVSSSHTS